MAKRKPSPQEYRPVADRLNSGLVAAVTKSSRQDVGRDEGPRQPEAQPSASNNGRPRRPGRGMFEREKRILMTKDDELRFNELVARLGSEFDVKLSASPVVRACLSLLHRYEAEIIAAARALPVGRRPSTGDAFAMAAFEDAIAEVLLRGLRRG